MNKYLVLVIVLVIILIVETTFVFLDLQKRELVPEKSYINIPKEDVNDNTDDEENNNSNLEDNQNSDTNTNGNNQFKVEISKDWVYDALYNLPTDKESYCITLDCIEMVYARDLIVPYVNINSNDAKVANQEIYELYEELIDIFNENSDYGIWYTDVEYDYYINDNILSVVITTSSGGTDVTRYRYYTYNFDLNTGNFTDYSEVYNVVDISSDDIDSLVADAITSIMEIKLDGLKDPLTDTGDGGYFPMGTNFDTFNNGSIDNYKTSVQDGTLKYFLDEDSKLNVIVTLLIPVGMGQFDTVITIG